MQKLLAGTAVGLSWAWAASPAVAQQAIGGEAQVPSISVDAQGVSGYKPDQPSLGKLTEPLRDTPQSITVVPRQVIEDRAITSVADALRNVPGVSLAAGEAGAQGNNLTLRGFSARNDIFLDGMRDFGSYYRDPFNFDSIEALKGPSSILFGRGSTGGVINQVSKIPRLDRFAEGTVILGTDATKRITADVNQPLPDLGQGASLRLNAMGNDNQVAGRDVGEYKRFGLAPTLALGLGTPTRLVISYVHQAEDDIPDYGIPALLGRPAPVNYNNYYGFKSGNYLRTNVDIGTVRIEHDFSSGITIRDQFRYANYDRNARITEAQIPAGVTAATPLSAINVTRNQLTVASTETFLQNQLDGTFKFRTGIFDHTVVAGVEAGQETSTPTRRTYLNVPTTSLLVPNYNQPFSGLSNLSTVGAVTTPELGLFAIDTIKYGEQWELIGGIRYDRFEADSNVTTYTAGVGRVVGLHRLDNLPSYRAALVYKPVPIGSVYFGYGTSFNPSAESLSLSVATAVLPPEGNRTFEVGTKWDLLQDKLSVRGALFRSEKTNARVPDPNDSTLTTLGGNQRADGFEIEASGKITEAWNIISGYSYQDAKVIKASPVATTAQPGAPLQNAPKHTLNVFTTYELPWGFTIGAGMNYVSSRVSRNTPPFTTVPGYVTFDALVKYKVNDNLNLQLNVTNIGDEKYIDLIHPSHLVPGARRTALLSTNVKF